MRFAFASVLIALLVPITKLSGQELFPERLEPWSLPVQTWVCLDPIGDLRPEARVCKPCSRMP